MLSTQLADINGRIMAAGQSGQSPNSIYDLRDKAVTDLSKLTDLTVSYSGRGVVTVKLGSSGVGPTIVDGKNAMKVGFATLAAVYSQWSGQVEKMWRLTRFQLAWLVAL